MIRSRRRFRPYRKTATARITSPAVSRMFFIALSMTHRIMLENVENAVGAGGAAGVAGICVGTSVAASGGTGITALANSATGQKWDSSAVTIPVSGW